MRECRTSSSPDAHNLGDSAPDPHRIKALLCECGKVRGHETPCLPKEPASVLEHAEAMVAEAKAGIAVALEALQPKVATRTVCISRMDADGVITDEWADL